MEKRYFILFGLESEVSAKKICSELKQIVGMKTVEICFKTGKMVLEAEQEAMPRIINAVTMIINILDYRITVMEERI